MLLCVKKQTKTSLCETLNLGYVSHTQFRICQYVTQQQTYSLIQWLANQTLQYNIAITKFKIGFISNYNKAKSDFRSICSICIHVILLLTSSLLMWYSYLHLPTYNVGQSIHQTCTNWSNLTPLHRLWAGKQLLNLTFVRKSYKYPVLVFPLNGLKWLCPHPLMFDLQVDQVIHTPAKWNVSSMM